MSLLSRLFDAFRSPEPAPVEPEVKQFAEAYGTTIDADEHQWRKLTGDAKRDLSPMTQQRMQGVAAYLWEANLLANRLIELPIAYLLSEGVRLTCTDEGGQKLLDRFWHDPINRMDERLPEWLRGLAIFGELALPAFVNEMNGRVRLGWLDASRIETVVLDPDNRAQHIGIVTTKDKRGEAQRWGIIVLGPEADCFTNRTQAIRATFQTGEIFYFRVNALPGGSRGRSDLLPQADWLDNYDEFLFGELDRARLMRAFVWDVTMKGATADEVRARASQIATPSPGTTRVHNDSEEWDSVTPGLQAADLTELGRLIRNHALGGATIPEHWFGGGGDVNRAVGAEMSEPTMKIFTMRQQVVKALLEAIGRYVLWCHKDPRRLTEIDQEDESLQCEAVFPEMTAKDTTKYASALQQVVAATNLAVDAGRMTELMAVQVIGLVAAKLGIESDAEKELKDAQGEHAKRARVQALRDSFSDPEDPEIQAKNAPPPSPGQSGGLT